MPNVELLRVMELSSSLKPERKDAAVWTEAFQVRSFEADVTGNLGILHLCNYLQEAAGNHARALGVSVDQLQDLDLTWMLSRLHVNVRRYPAWRDTIYIDTWPSGHNGLLASREFLIYTEAGDQIGKATSAWLMIDLKHHRPLRVPEFIDALPIPDLPRPIPDPFKKIEGPQRGSTGKTFSVGYNDLDINRHANNVRYIGWALESMPLDIIQTHHLEGLEVQFRAEAKYGVEVLSAIEQGQDERGLIVRHILHSRDEGRELATARTRWSPEKVKGKR